MVYGGYELLKSIKNKVDKYVLSETINGNCNFFHFSVSQKFVNY